MLLEPVAVPKSLAHFAAGPQLAGRIVARTIVGHPALPAHTSGGSRFVRIVRRLARYALLGTAMYLGGWAAGMYLPIGWTGAVTTGIAVTGGARAAVLASQDLSRIAFFAESDFLRTVISGKVGGLFGLIPFAGAFHGVVSWTIRAGRRSVRQALRSSSRHMLYGRPFGTGSLGGAGPLRGF